ncbi:MAG: Chromosome partition protein Smc [Verrucomicrobia bacterium ADurb.Bin070]|nr:MAG: Chromosome partition protein Smc [Verrucomicrobia bacterium ADurb.Bin070]
MATATRHSGSEDPAPTWWVRDEQGGQYGPVGFDVLQAWARDGRIGPSNQISADGVAWLPAVDEPALEMDWVAEVTGGRFYGPIHRDAVRSLIGEGAIATRAALFRRGALEARDAAAECRRLEDALRAAASRTEQSEAMCRQAHSETAAWQRQSQEAEDRAAAEHAAACAAAAALQAAEARVAQAEQRAAEQAAALQAAEARRAQAEQRAAEQASSLQAAETRVAQAEQRAAEQAAALQAAETRVAQAEQRAAEQAAALSEKLRVAQEQLGAAQREQARWQTEAARALEDCAARMQRIAQLEAEVERVRKAAEVPRVQVLDAEPVETETDRTGRPSARTAVCDAELLPPEEPVKAQQQRPSPADGGCRRREGVAGLSLADIERQARLELQRLGANGSAFFAKKR